MDHIVPFARGGDNSPSNLRLLCGKHNRLEAERVYGREKMVNHTMKHGEQHLKEHRGKYLKKAGGQYAMEHGVLYGWLKNRGNPAKNPAWNKSRSWNPEYPRPA